MKKWVFYVCDLNGDARDEQTVLNQLAKQGWELISVAALSMCRRVYLKRPIDTQSENSADNTASAPQENNVEDTCEFLALKKPLQDGLNFGEY